MPLTDIAVRGAKPGTKPFRLFDAGGLYLEVAPSGGKWWRLKYRFDRKEKRLSLGTYPAVSLKDARGKRDATKKLLADGIDPSASRRAERAASSNTFEAVAREWFLRHEPGWAKTHSDKVIRRLELNVFPWLGSRPIAQISAPDLLQVMRRIEERGAVDTTHRVLQYCGQVFRYAVATGRAHRDPAADLKGAIPPPIREHHATLTDPRAVGELLRAIHAYNGSTITRCALRLAPLLFVRPGELRRAEWAEFNFDLAEWRIPASKMKAGALLTQWKQCAPYKVRRETRSLRIQLTLRLLDEVRWLARPVRSRRPGRKTLPVAVCNDW